MLATISPQGYVFIVGACFFVCSVCLVLLAAANARLMRERARRRAAQYGKVPPEEFDRLRKELPVVDPEKHRTFREDYEFYGAQEGEVKASYSGRCSNCGLAVDLKTSKRFWPEEASR